MTVRCEGDSWAMEQAGEKQDFEAELSRLGLRHEDFTLHVRRGRLGGLDRGWGAHYAVRVTNNVTGNRGIYLGGAGEAWVAQFAADAANGLYRNPSMMSKLPLRVRKSLRDAGSERR